MTRSFRGGGEAALERRTFEDISHSQQGRIATSAYRHFGVIVGQVYVVGVLVIAAALYCSIGASPGSWIYPASLIHVLACAWMFWAWRVQTGGLFDPYGLFLIAAALYNGSLMLLETLHLNSPSLTNGRLPPEVVLQAIFLVTAGLACLHLGALIGVTMVPKRAGHAGAESQDADRLNTKIVGWMLLSIALFPAVSELRSAMSTVMSHGYFGLYQRTFAVGMGAAPRVLATFLFPGVFFLLAGSKRGGVSGWVAGLIVAVWVCCDFFLGYRGQMLGLIAFAWLWHRAIRPLPKLAQLVAAGSLIVMLPVIAEIRTVPGEYRMSLGVIVQALERVDNPIVAVLREVGDTFWTVAYTVHFVPASRPFELGASYAYAFLRVLPNLFWAIHPGLGHSPSDWLIRTADPRTAAAGGGIGYSFLAEAYLNFGWIGGPLLLVVLGFGLGRTVAFLRTHSDPARLALMASAMTFFIFYVRADLGTVIRGVAWYALGPYAAVRLLGILRLKTPSRVAMQQGPESEAWT